MRTKGTKKNNVTLRQRKTTTGYFSLYLDIYREGVRSYKYLRLYIKEHPRTAQERATIKETLALAEKARALHEVELNNNAFGFTPPHKSKVNIHDFCRRYIERYTHKDIRMVSGSYLRFTDFLNAYHPQLTKTLQANQLTKPLMEEYKDYLYANGTGEGPRSYFQRFKKILNAALEEKILTDNPAKGIVCRSDMNLKKDILSLGEIEQLARAKCGNPEVKRAFLFCCYSGLRFCDVKSLTYGNVDFGNNRLQFEQAKTKGHSSNSVVTLDLSPTMKTIIGEKGSKKNNDLIFHLPSHNAALSALAHWMKRAGIDKHITWHCARHSFAVLMLSHTDLKTVSGLLGHSSLKCVEQYTRILDERKKNAINSLPTIDIEP